VHNNSILGLDANQKKLYSKERVGDIYPEYYVIKVNNFDENAKDTLDEWIYFLKTEKIESNFKAKGLSEAKKKLDYMKFDETERARYERFKENLHDQASAWESTYVIGKIEGKIEGRLEGKIEGIEQEREESRKKIETIATNLILAQLDIQTIMQSTGLEKEEIERLKSLCNK